MRKEEDKTKKSRARRRKNSLGKGTWTEEEKIREKLRENKGRVGKETRRKGRDERRGGGGQEERQG